MPDEVFVHVGLSKSGTSYLQESLCLSQGRLAEEGVLVPGSAPRRFQRLAFWDLLGRRFRGVRQPLVPGSWQGLVETVSAWQGSRVVLSEEFLANARVGHARRIVHAFAPAQVHVVATVRRLDAVICSMWQQEVAKRRTTLSWPEFVAAVRDPEHGPPTAGVAFWLRQDLRKVLGVWESVVPPQRIHVVIVPSPGSAPTDLLDRFATAIGLDAGVLTAPSHEVNTGLDVVGTEVLRRLNAALGGRLNERQYLRAIRHAVKPALRTRSGVRPISLPAAERCWVSERSQELVEFLERSSYDVVGELHDLLPTQRSADDRHGLADSAPTDAEVAAAAIAALSTTVEKYACGSSRRRGRGRRTKATGIARLRSIGRAIGFRARVAALELADRNRVLGRAARRYLRHRSPESHTS